MQVITESHADYNGLSCSNLGTGERQLRWLEK